MPRTALRFLLAAAGLMAAAGSPPGVAQEPSRPPDVTGVVSGQGFTKVRIALPDSSADGASRAVAAETASALRDDLDFSGFFDIVDPALYPLVATSAEKAEHARWMSIGAATTVFFTVTQTGDRIDLRARLQDNLGGTTLFDRRYGGTSDLVRRVAHQLADDIVEQFTGRPGVAMTRIAFVSKYGKGKELYVMDYDGQRIRRITTTGTINLSPVWSPVSERLAFVSWRGGQPGVHILESDGRLTQAATAGGEMNAAPDWSPDGRKIVYSSDVDGNAELYVLDLTARRNTRLTRSAAIETSPTFSPNGREIAFTSDRSGTPQIYVIDAEGLSVRRVSFDGNYNESAAWSPRGDKLAFASRIDGKFDIVVLDLASGTVSRLTRGEGNNENPRWAPDGRHLVFASNRRGTYDIYSMAADGTGVRRLTTGGDCFTPDWSRKP